MRNSTLRNGIRIVFRYLGEYRKDVIALSFLGLVSALTGGVVPYVSGRFFDAIIVPSTVLVGDSMIPLWLFLIGVWTLLRVVGNVADWKINVKSDRIGESMYAHYVSGIFGHMLELPISFHKKHKTGETEQRIDRAANALQDITSRVIIALMPEFMSILVGFAIIFLIKPLLAGVILLGIALYVAVVAKINPVLERLAKSSHRAYGRAYGGAYDAIFNVRNVKQTTAEGYEKRKIFKRFWLTASQAYLKWINRWHGLSLYQNLVVTLTQLALFILSVYFITRGEMTIGELVMFNGYAAMAFGPFVRLGNDWHVVQNGAVALERGEKLVVMRTERYVPVNPVALDDIKGEIGFRNVYFRYEKAQRDILRGVTFTVQAGKTVALVGESGVGKTTLVDLICGYYFPRRGMVSIDGVNIRNLDLHFLRSKIAVVPQEVVLFNDTVKRNIAYGVPHASDEEILDAAEKSYASEFINSFPKKFGQRVGERGVRLSIGQKQRIAIARAFLRDPRILILDEPTSALDAKSEHFIQESLERLMEGRTTFIIAHRLSTVRKADAILVIKSGKIVEEGKHEALLKLKGGIYRGLHELQMGPK